MEPSWIQSRPSAGPPSRIEGAERLEEALEALRQLERELAAAQRGEIGDAPGRRRRVHTFGARLVGVDRNGQQHTVVLEQAGQDLLVGEVREPRREHELDAHADGAGIDGRERVLLAGLAGEVPALAGSPVRGGVDVDALADDERRQESQPELTNELRAGMPRLFRGRRLLAESARVAGADGGEVALDLILGEAGARVLDDDDALAAGGDDDGKVGRGGILEAAADARVVRVLHELSDRHGGRRVEVLAQDLHQAEEIDLRLLDLGVGDDRGGERRRGEKCQLVRGSSASRRPSPAS